MRILVIGANGTVGRHAAQALKERGHTVIAVGKKSGDFQVDIENRESILALFRQVGEVDAVVNTAGETKTALVEELKAKHWNTSLQSKFLGQVNVTQIALPFIKAGGSITLITGFTSEEPIRGQAVKTAINRAVEGFVSVAALELPAGFGSTW